MNRFFLRRGEGWPRFPRKAFARLDQTEPVDVNLSTEALFAFDAVDANWGGFGPGGSFDLNQPERPRSRLVEFWSGMSAPRETPPAQNPFDELPLYRIEVTSRPGDAFWNSLKSLTEEDWYTLELSDAGSFPVDVYGGILAAAVEAHLLSLTITRSRESAALSAQFDVDLWPDATDTDIGNVISGRGPLESIVGYDVGQGAAIGLLDSGENARIFFDLGAGAYGNAKTRPTPLRFCWRKRPPVILSHWDTDHWAGETTDPLAAQATWIAPRQKKLGPTHHAFASRIVAAGGALLVWGAPAGTVRTHTLAPNQTLTLARCTGSSRNGSGIAALAEDSRLNRAWLITGDAGYHELGLTLPARLSTVVVPHHGADMGPKSVPPARPNGYTRLVYTFGPGNTHGRTHVTHPTSASVNHHAAQGWSHGTWSLTTPALSVAGGDVLATAENPSSASGGRHLESTAGGWSTAPGVPFRTVPCATSPTSSTGCTSRIVQA
jgi:hypothetical protein